MSGHKRTAQLLAAGIAGLGATLALTAAVVVPARAVPAQDLRAAESDVGLAILPAQDYGAQNYRGARDFQAAELAGGPTPAAPATDLGTRDYRGARDFQAAGTQAGR